jgi:2-amino-4-hydroxy-6-hydroxymethyldihydropteridine diphosphokinase
MAPALPRPAPGANGHRVVIALGGNRPHGRHGSPPRVLRAAVEALRAAGLYIESVSRIRTTAPLGPSTRVFANAALVAHWPGSLHTLLDLLQATERAFGRRRARRWAARVLDLDILAAGPVQFRSPRLTVPHPALAQRSFALDPLRDLDPRWRHPTSGLTPRHMRSRLAKPRPTSSSAAVGS